MSSKNRSKNNLILLRTKTRITKSEISMRIWRSWMSTASQGTFVVIAGISLCDIPDTKRAFIRKALFIMQVKLPRNAQGRCLPCLFEQHHKARCDADHSESFTIAYSKASLALSSRWKVSCLRTLCGISSISARSPKSVSSWISSVSSSKFSSCG